MTLGSVFNILLLKNSIFNILAMKFSIFNIQLLLGVVIFNILQAQKLDIQCSPGSKTQYSIFSDVKTQYSIFRYFNIRCGDLTSTVGASTSIDTPASINLWASERPPPLLVPPHPLIQLRIPPPIVNPHPLIQLCTPPLFVPSHPLIHQRPPLLLVPSHPNFNCACTLTVLVH